jgi:hypothetical protein
MCWPAWFPRPEPPPHPGRQVTLGDFRLDNTTRYCRRGLRRVNRWFKLRTSRRRIRAVAAAAHPFGRAVERGPASFRPVGLNVRRATARDRQAALVPSSAVTELFPRTNRGRRRLSRFEALFNVPRRTSGKQPHARELTTPCARRWRTPRRTSPGCRLEAAEEGGLRRNDQARKPSSNSPTSGCTRNVPTRICGQWPSYRSACPGRRELRLVTDETSWRTVNRRGPDSLGGRGRIVGWYGEGLRAAAVHSHDLTWTAPRHAGTRKPRRDESCFQQRPCTARETPRALARDRAPPAGDSPELAGTPAGVYAGAG